MTLVCAVLVGCKTPGDSDVLVVGGRDVLPSEFPEAIMIGECSGTFVSPTTLITAKHCILTRSGLFQLFSFKGHIPKTTLLPRDPILLEVNKDVAVLVCAQPVTTAWATVATVPAAVDDPLEIVGFGCNVPNSPYGVGIKRAGKNRIGKLTPSLEFCLPSTGATSCPGDSGGPNFIDGRLAGVTSYSGAASCKVNLTAPDMQKFLRQATAFGAEITGIESTTERDYAGIQMFDERTFEPIFAGIAASRAAAMPAIKAKVAELAQGGQGSMHSWAAFPGPGVDSGAVSDIRDRLRNKLGACAGAAPLKCLPFPLVLTQVLNIGHAIDWTKSLLASKNVVLTYLKESGTHAAVWEELEAVSDDPLDVYLINERAHVRTHALYVDGTHAVY